ncbi:hypothetical protein BN14_11458 [Rhizoctonia solani AG-1 IB]|uniref:Uncharacterized protein n=1 Tax=Thanatephorus cucumeris (strain AG1-IB / isolate 7/3/14) TaxID=1108050 RepID=M5CBC5_THACB|nr:hypothetical protein BN14_11458 [Rhizoctonia solani AG-1 IB]
MSSSTKVLISSVVDQWETASARLDESFLAYMEASLALGRHTPASKSDAMDLVSRIDHKFDTLYASLEKQLPQSRWTLARTRNKLASSFYAIPGEVLAQIFRLVVCERNNRELVDGGNKHPRVLPAAIFAHGSLLILEQFGWFPEKPTKVSLQRALGRELHLMARIKTRSEAPEYFIEATGNIVWTQCLPLFLIIQPRGR